MELEVELLVVVDDVVVSFWGAIIRLVNAVVEVSENSRGDPKYNDVQLVVQYINKYLLNLNNMI